MSSATAVVLASRTETQAINSHRESSTCPPLRFLPLLACATEGTEGAGTLYQTARTLAFAGVDGWDPLRRRARHHTRARVRFCVHHERLVSGYSRCVRACVVNGGVNYE